MATTSATNKSLSVKAYQGDAKTLLAWNLSVKKAPANLAGYFAITADKREILTCLVNLKLET